MRVVVLGSGVVGVTSAYYLAQAGHEVTVVDRQAGPALETSFANAGQISPGYASPWAAPGMPLKALKWMMQKHAPLAIRLDGTHSSAMDVADARNCTPERYAVNKARMVRLAEYSRDCLHRAARRNRHRATKAAARARCSCSARSSSSTMSASDIDVLKQYGVPYEVLDPTGCIAAEPALAAVARQARRRPAPAERRDRRLPAVHHAPGRAREAARRDVPLRHDDRRRSSTAGDRITGVAHGDGTLTRRRLCRRAGQLLAATARAARHPRCRSIRSRAIR